MRQHFSGGHQIRSIRPAASAGSDDLATVSVGQLLERYAGILAELRLRGLVRTNNAPIGDLAEYCAAIVYDGLLAPKSEKSYDLVAQDGRKVQVKVRVIRSDTSPSAVFSPIRSFGFDVGAFLLIDGDRGGVLAARELTAEDVQHAGKHRAHTNGVVVRVGQVRSATARGSTSPTGSGQRGTNCFSKSAERQRIQVALGQTSQSTTYSSIPNASSWTSALT